MLTYKINENINRSGDYTYMINLVNEDYKNFFKAFIITFFCLGDTRPKIV